MLLLILASSVVLALDRPGLEPQSRLAQVLRVCNVIFAYAFLAEAVLKVRAHSVWVASACAGVAAAAGSLLWMWSRQGALEVHSGQAQPCLCLPGRSRAEGTSPQRLAPAHGSCPHGRYGLPIEAGWMVNNSSVKPGDTCPANMWRPLSPNACMAIACRAKPKAHPEFCIVLHSEAAWRNWSCWCVKQWPAWTSCHLCYTHHAIPLHEGHACRLLAWAWCCILAPTYASPGTSWIW